MQAPPGSRIQLSRARGWRMPTRTVKCDRSTVFGNPWKSGLPGLLRLPAGALRGRMTWDAPRQMDHALTTDETIGLHADWLRNGNAYLPAGLSEPETLRCLDALAETRATVLDLLAELRGFSFACWCAPDGPCHAQTLLEIANG
ncbi:DUF4326 domain-containing protein [Pseudogemmobacter faecipullorum]|nr:DUF4326 domain-containing protein [Pseudogemmobacter faecipullorum]